LQGILKGCEAAFKMPSFATIDSAISIFYAYGVKRYQGEQEPEHGPL